jgi:uncharacterized protein (TIGR03067 family)
MLTVTLLGLCMLVPQDDRKNDQTDAARYVGMYQVTAGERNGEKIPAEQLEGVRVRIAANAITTYDKNKKEVYVASFTIDTGRQPHRVTLTAKVTPGDKGEGTKSEGLIKMADDAVTLVYALPGGTAPTDFKTTRGQQMFIMKKAEK